MRTTHPEAIKTHLLPASLSSMVAGSLVGLIESVIIIAKYPQLEELSLLYYSVVSYGLLGLLLGCGLSLVGGFIFRKRDKVNYSRVAAFYSALTFFIVSFVIARFILIRDFLHEQPLSPLHYLFLLTSLVLISLFLYLILQATTKDKTIKGVLSFLGIVWVCFLLAGVAVSYTTAPPRTPPPPPGTLPDTLQTKPNVILILVDTLRADHLSCYGYQGNATPSIDRLAADGTLYEKAFGQSSWTKPQVATLLTSLYPSSHATYLKPHILPDALETLPEIMREMGYFTCGIANIVHLSSGFNFHQGFERYSYLAPDFFFLARESSSHLCLYHMLRLVRERFLSRQKYVSHYYQDARTVNRLACDWIKECKATRFFLFLHYMEPHDPYFEHPYTGRAIARVSTPHPDPSLAPVMRKLYDGEIAYLDRCLGELIDFLKQEGIYDDALIILTADHGEEFYEHKGWWHGTTLYDEQIHIPLIIKYPGYQHKGTVNTNLVRTLDIAPTILDYVNHPIPQTMQGTSLLKDYQLRSPQAREIFSEENLEYNILKSLRTEEWKLILANQDNPRGLAPQELYRVNRDPEEQENVAENEQEMVNNMISLIDHHLTRALIQAAQEKIRPIDKTTEDRLRALGYVQ